jgi:predicted transcriptional regulator
MSLKYDRKMTIYLTEDLRNRLQEIADKEQVKISAIIRKILINYLEE